MQNLIQILLLFLTPQLAFNTAAGTVELYGNDPAGIQPAEEAHLPIANSDRQSGLYTIHFQSEGAAVLVNQVPQPYSTAERHVKLFVGSPSESLIERRGAIYLYLASLIEPGLPVYNLLFPFHFFL